MSDPEGASDAMSVCETLVKARIAAGLSQTEVADELFLTPSMIGFLDSGEFHRLPNVAFVRGYIRSYARIVGLDPGTLIRQFDEERAQEEPETLDQVPPQGALEPRFSGVVQAGLMSLGLIAVLVFAVLMFSSNEGAKRAVRVNSDSAVLEQSGDASARQVKTDAEFNETQPPLVDNPEALPSKALSDADGSLSLEESDDVMPSVLEAPPFDAAVKAPVGDETQDSSGVETSPNGNENPAQEAGAPGEPLGFGDERLDESSEPRKGLDTVVATSREKSGLKDILGAASPEDGAVRDTATTTPQSALEAEGGRLLSFESEETNDRLRLDTRPRSLSTVSITREVFDGGRRIWVDAGGSDELTAELSDECWIEVKNAQGELIYGDLNRAGDALMITGFAPFSVLVGKATGVSLAFNGERVDLAARTTREFTARVTLGN